MNFVFQFISKMVKGDIKNKENIFVLLHNERYDC